jgi:hypothetical protein
VFQSAGVRAMPLGRAGGGVHSCDKGGDEDYLGDGGGSEGRVQVPRRTVVMMGPGSMKESETGEAMCAIILTFGGG